MADRQAIDQLLAEYAWANDTNDIALLERLLVDDMSFSVSIAGALAVGPLEPRTAVLDFVGGALDGQSGQRRHCISNLRLVEDAEDRASFTAYLSIFATTDGTLEAVSTGYYDGVAVRDPDGRWLLRSLLIALDRPF